MPLQPQTKIPIACALLLDAAGRTLLVRKRGTIAFMQPGGKIAAGEAADQALVRELREELGLRVAREALIGLGRFEAPAANEPGDRVIADLFLARTGAIPVAASEIEEAVWIAPGQAIDVALAPLTRDHVLPLWRGGAGAATGQ